MIILLNNLKERATELLELGDSKEKAKGRGMMEVITAIESAPPTYVLFGLDAIHMLYNDKSPTEIGEMINAECIGDLAKFDATDSTNAILDRASGWGDYAIITESEYNEINNKLV